MLSFHHITHAVCIILISFLCKKYMEMRSLYSDLKFEHGQLKLHCQNTPSHEVANLHGGVCHCPCQQGHNFAQSRTEFRIKSQDNGGQFGSASPQQMFSEAFEPSVPMGDFGQTFSQAGQDSHQRADITGNAATTVFQQMSQLPPMDYGPSVQASVTSLDVRASKPAHARPPLDRQTDVSQNPDVSFQTTSESLESVAASPSSSLLHGSYSSRLPDSDGNGDRGSPGDSNSDYYLGSSSRENDGEQEEDVIVTSIGKIHDKPLHPHGVDLLGTYSVYDDDGYLEEWEEVEEDIEEEEQPHPAFGNVKLQELSEKDINRLSTVGSSVECSGSDMSDRMCRFSNLCFKPHSREFVFLLGPRSVEVNVPKLKPQEALMELSTVAGHNAQYFSYLTVHASSVKTFRIALVAGTTVVFRRFKPDNIMHAFHDDIIPLFYTLLSLDILPERVMEEEHLKFPVSLFLSDENNEGEFYNLYKAFSAGDAFTANSLEASFAKSGAVEEGMVCFADTHVGLSKRTTWYQYGFFKPQGPIQDFVAESEQIHGVSSYLLNSFAKDCPLCRDGGHLVLISRKETRRILNEMELVLALSKHFRLKVMTVSLDTHTLDDILPVVHTSLGIIGMHGSLLSLAGFLRQGSVVVELFPYAVNPDHYTPYHTLAQLPGMLLAYRAWANQDRDSSVMHPDWSREFGGLQHLPAQQQQGIMSQMEVPRHLCCEDPSWLFHIFQDTHVNIPQVMDVVASALEEARPLRSIHTDTPTTGASKPPGPPQRLKCSAGEGNVLSLQWAPPWNVHVFAKNSMRYRILVEDVGSGNAVFSSLCSSLQFTVTEGVQQASQYRVWVTGVVDGMPGPFAAVDVCSDSEL